MTVTKIWVLVRVLSMLNSAITRISPVGDEVNSRIQGFSKCTHGGDSNDDSGSASQRPSTYVSIAPLRRGSILASTCVVKLGNPGCGLQGVFRIGDNVLHNALALLGPNSIHRKYNYKAGNYGARENK